MPKPPKRASRWSSPTTIAAISPPTARPDRLIYRDNTYGTPEEDAFRRDFTVNALFYDIANFSIIDYVGGLRDLDAKVIRSIGEPDVRFLEDPVRMLRAVVLAARLEFTIEKPILESIAIHKHEIARSAPARLVEEYYKILRSGHAREAFKQLRSTGLLKVITPGARSGSRGSHTSRVRARSLSRSLRGCSRHVDERHPRRHHALPGRPHWPASALLRRSARTAGGIGSVADCTPRRRDGCTKSSRCSRVWSTSTDRRAHSAAFCTALRFRKRSRGWKSMAIARMRWRIGDKSKSRGRTRIPLRKKRRIGPSGAGAAGADAAVRPSRPSERPGQLFGSATNR